MSSEKVRERYRARYAANCEVIREQKKINRRKYYAQNKDIESLRNLIRYYKKKDDTEKVDQLQERLVGLLEAKNDLELTTPAEV
jgi:hypothetical protein